MSTDLILNCEYVCGCLWTDCAASGRQKRSGEGRGLLGGWIRRNLRVAIASRRGRHFFRGTRIGLATPRRLISDGVGAFAPSLSFFYSGSVTRVTMTRQADAKLFLALASLGEVANCFLSSNTQTLLNI